MGVSYSGHVTKDSDPAQLASRLVLPPALRASGYGASLTMQPPTDPELPQLLELIERGIHDPSEMPLLTSWTDTPSPHRERDSLSHWWRLRAVVDPRLEMEWGRPREWPDGGDTGFDGERFCRHPARQIGLVAGP
jgi:hypothetical protein